MKGKGKGKAAKATAGKAVPVKKARPGPTKKAAPAKKAGAVSSKKAAPAKKAGARASRGPLDLVRLHAEWFSAKRTPEVVRLPALNCLAVEGRGAPESREFHDAVAALLGVAELLKLAQQGAGREFKIPPLEALWWTDYDLTRLADPRALWRVPRHTWRWKALLVLPEFVTSEDVRAARQMLSDRRGGDPLPTRVQLVRIDEGTCVQVLHVGPHAEEPKTVAKMQAWMKEEELTPCGFHHEIYLVGPHTSPTTTPKTILRQPVR